MTDRACVITATALLVLAASAATAQETPRGNPPAAAMARYTLHTMLVSLNIVDTPLSYTPAVGPPVEFTVT